MFFYWTLMKSPPFLAVTWLLWVWQGWQGAQTIPREVTYDKASQTLLFNPVHETAQLRVKTLASLQGNLTDHATPATVSRSAALLGHQQNSPLLLASFVALFQEQSRARQLVSYSGR